MSGRSWGLPAAALFAAVMAAIWVWANRPEPEAPLPPRPPPVTPARRPKPETPAGRIAPAPPVVPALADEGPEVPAEGTPPGFSPPPMVRVHGTVRDSAGHLLDRATVWVRWEGSGGRWFSKSDGTFEFEVAARDLVIQAERKDGLLGARSEEVTVAGADGGDWTVDLVVPEGRKAGLGIGIAAAEGGVRVRMVHPGTPAERMGLEVGELITAVDGQETAGMKVEEFVERMTGPEGTTVRFSVTGKDGEPEEMKVRREILAPVGGPPRQ